MDQEVPRSNRGICTISLFKKTGREEGIRTLDGLLTHTPLAGERLQPLGHLSGVSDEDNDRSGERKGSHWLIGHCPAP